jgi:hypothetical protein
MYHLVVCLFFGIFAYKAFTEFGIFQAIAPIFLVLVFFASTLLSITDNYRFRIIILASHLLLSAITLASFVFYSISLASFVFLSIIFAQSLLIIAIVFFPKRNKSYYIWCKSIAGKS